LLAPYPMTMFSWSPRRARSRGHLAFRLAPLTSGRRRWKRAIACIGLSAFVIGQFALSAYACAEPGAGEAVSMVATKFCHGDIDHGQSKLCEQHCVQSAQSVDTLPQVALAPPLLPLMALTDSVDRHAPSRMCGTAIRDISRSPPPLARFSVLRI